MWSGPVIALYPASGFHSRDPSCQRYGNLVAVFIGRHGTLFRDIAFCNSKDNFVYRRSPLESKLCMYILSFWSTLCSIVELFGRFVVTALLENTIYLLKCTTIEYFTLRYIQLFTEIFEYSWNFYTNEYTYHVRYTKHLIRFVTRFDCREHIGKIWNKSDRAQKLSDISTIRRARNFVIEIRINTTLSKICNSLNTFVRQWTHAMLEQLLFRTRLGGISFCSVAIDFWITTLRY